MQYRQFLVAVRFVDLPQHAVSIQKRPFLGTDLFAEQLWEYAEFCGVGRVVGADMTRCLDFNCQCARIIGDKT